MKVVTKYPVYINNERVGKMDNQYLYANGFFQNVKDRLGKGLKFAEERGFVDPLLGLAGLQRRERTPSASELAEIERQRVEQEKKEKEAKRKKNIMYISIAGGVVLLGVVAFVLMKKK
jgi:hypothetical protein